MTSTRALRLKNQIAAFWKRCLSIRKKDWELNDYPVVIREHEFDPHFSSGRFTQHRYVAYIVNWAVKVEEKRLRTLCGASRSTFKQSGTGGD